MAAAVCWQRLHVGASPRKQGERVDAGWRAVCCGSFPGVINGAPTLLLCRPFMARRCAGGGARRGFTPEARAQRGQTGGRVCADRQASLRWLSGRHGWRRTDLRFAPRGSPRSAPGTLPNVGTIFKSPGRRAGSGRATEANGGRYAAISRARRNASLRATAKEARRAAALISARCGGARSPRKRRQNGAGRAP